MKYAFLTNHSLYRAVLILQFQDTVCMLHSLDDLPNTFIFWLKLVQAYSVDIFGIVYNHPDDSEAGYRNSRMHCILDLQHGINCLPCILFLVRRCSKLLTCNFKCFLCQLAFKTYKFVNLY